MIRKLAFGFAAAAAIACGGQAVAAPLSPSDIDAKLLAANHDHEKRLYAKAVGEIRPLAQLGDARAEHWLAGSYFLGLGVRRNYAESFKWYQLAASQGDADAQYQTGFAYDHGQGVAESPAQAVHWYRLSASQGNDAGQQNMCLMYFLGRGVPQDYSEAYTWCDLAVKNANAEDRPSEEHARAQVALHLTSDQIADSHKSAEAWRPTDLRRGKTACADPACNTSPKGFE